MRIQLKNSVYDCEYYSMLYLAFIVIQYYLLLKINFITDLDIYATLFLNDITRGNDSTINALIIEIKLGLY